MTKEFLFAIGNPKDPIYHPIVIEGIIKFELVGTPQRVNEKYISDKFKEYLLKNFGSSVIIKESEVWVSFFIFTNDEDITIKELIDSYNKAISSPEIKIPASTSVYLLEISSLNQLSPHPQRL